MKSRFALVLTLLTEVLYTTNAAAQPVFPSSFSSQTVNMAGGASIFVRSRETSRCTRRATTFASMQGIREVPGERRQIAIPRRYPTLRPYFFKRHHT